MLLYFNQLTAVSSHRRSLAEPRHHRQNCIPAPAAAAVVVAAAVAAFVQAAAALAPA